MGQCKKVDVWFSVFFITDTMVGAEEMVVTQGEEMKKEQVGKNKPDEKGELAKECHRLGLDRKSDQSGFEDEQVQKHPSQSHLGFCRRLPRRATQLGSIEGGL